MERVPPSGHLRMWAWLYIAQVLPISFDLTFSWYEDKLAFAWLGSDLILHIINNTIHILLHRERDLETLEEHGDHEPNFRKSKVFADALS